MHESLRDLVDGLALMVFAFLSSCLAALVLDPSPEGGGVGEGGAQLGSAYPESLGLCTPMEHQRELDAWDAQLHPQAAYALQPGQCIRITDDDYLSAVQVYAQQALMNQHYELMQQALANRAFNHPGLCQSSQLQQSAQQNSWDLAALPMQPSQWSEKLQELLKNSKVDPS